MPLHCVIGSGPAGVACATALRERGAEVLMLDAGATLEADRAAVVSSLAKQPIEEWDPAVINTVAGHFSGDARGIPLKLSWGSDFAYRERSDLLEWSGVHTGARPSFALGGLSNVWGAAVLPYTAADTDDWPISIADLEAHYCAAANICGLSGRADSLSELLPLYCEPRAAMPLSAQGKKLLGRLLDNAEQFARSGWHFGQSRLAARAAADGSQRGCERCGLCLSGCPFACIYNSASTVNALSRPLPGFEYRGGIVVTHVRESGAQVVITARDIATEQPLSIVADRAYLATGFIPTTHIVLRSLAAFDNVVEAVDSQYFLFPLFSFEGDTRAATESRHTLSQVFVELNKKEISPRLIHLQVYTHNETIADAVRNALGPLRILSSMAESRVMVVQGYLHSDDSQRIAMVLKRTSTNASGDRLEITGGKAARPLSVVRNVVRECRRRWREMGAFVPPGLARIGEPGRGFHSGGTFPMRHSPGKFQTDAFGRIPQWRRVHIVDASIFPTIPATTITLSVMANAHRIGTAMASL